jgi:hypothetical protein
MGGSLRSLAQYSSRAPLLVSAGVPNVSGYRGPSLALHNLCRSDPAVMSAMRKILAVAFIAALASACSDGCGNNIVSAAASPDGDFTAALFQRDCGATTGFSSQVSITRSNKAISGAGNVFVADDDHGIADAARWGGPWVELRWLSPRQLVVRYDAKARVFKQEATVSGVTVTYEKVLR